MQTARLKLISCTEPLLHILLRGDQALSQHLNIQVPTQWSEFGKSIFRYTLEKLEAGDPAEWWTWLPILRKEATLVGSCGYKGSPNDWGMVEIGYEVSRPFRNQGLATEMASALIKNALVHPDVKYVQAHTMAEENASTHVLKKCGMKMVESVEMPGEGMVWRWKIQER
jgi:ribosomal-protein-alanine N-acetyltransferase